MTTSWGGPAAVVLFAAWLAYYVPMRVGMRQQVVDARAADRFSGGLRVLAVARSAGGATGSPVPARRVEGPVVTGGVPLLASGPHGAGESGEEARMTTKDPEAVASPVRLAAPVRDARRAAARRRRTLSAGLLVVTVVVAVLVGVRLLPWPVLVAPVLLLGGVLELGRRATLAGRRADAARLEAARRRALEARRQALGSPLAPRYAARGDRRRVTGHAVQPSQTATQMIPRVSAEDLERARRAAARRRPDVDDGAPRATRETPQGRVAPVAEPVVETVASGATDGATWEPVPVPPPTYTMKPRAPRPPQPPLPDPLPEPTPAPVAADDLAGLAAPGRVTVPADVKAPADARVPAEAAGPSEPSPTTETLGLSLDAILARRRAVGE